ncbi:hypothetical protein GCM10010218_39160 [Streptomyces mashuensis]|uniref:Uncharacterized protein n=1 Tax=Streptomyces mashuensis TaxID=33904 RepID=A0A919B672_9ACTN|nr:hypothetical protein GCM10010218_39160 [Streptomyces mashuensis]
MTSPAPFSHIEFRTGDICPGLCHRRRLQGALDREGHRHRNNRAGRGLSLRADKTAFEDHVTASMDGTYDGTVPQGAKTTAIKVTHAGVSSCFRHRLDSARRRQATPWPPDWRFRRPSLYHRSWSSTRVLR